MTARVAFRRFLRSRGISIAEAARQLGVTAACVSQWLSGASRPSLANRGNIETWTHGEVLAASWLRAAERRGVPVRPFAAAAE